MKTKLFLLIFVLIPSFCFGAATIVRTPDGPYVVTPNRGLQALYAWQKPQPGTTATPQAARVPQAPRTAPMPAKPVVRAPTTSTPGKTDVTHTTVAGKLITEWTENGKRWRFTPCDINPVADPFNSSTWGSATAKAIAQLTPTVNYFSRSPRGNTIAFSGQAIDPATGQNVQGLFFANTNGTLVNVSKGEYATEEIAYSPDGRWLAITKLVTNNTAVAREIWLKKLVGGEENKKLTPGSKPIWSPDGKYILFQVPNTNYNGFSVINVSGEYWKTYELVNNFDAGRRVQVLSGSFPNPCWSPDGRHIFCSDNKGVFFKRFNSDEYWRAAVDNPDPNWSHCRAIKFSVAPDGQQLAFVAQSNLWVAFCFPGNVVGSNPATWKQQGPENLTKNAMAVEAVTPVWSPDGANISFAAGGQFWTISVVTDLSEVDQPKQQQNLAEIAR